VGAGFCLAMSSDLRIAAKDAKLSANFVKLGLHPGKATPKSSSLHCSFWWCPLTPLTGIPRRQAWALRTTCPDPSARKWRTVFSSYAPVSTTGEE
jgi:hypothetical protein